MAAKPAQLSPWRTLKTTSVVDIPPWLSVLRDEIELPSGRVVPDYYRITTPDYALVCARGDDGRVLMERHYKQCLGKYILTSPAGGVEQDEQPLDAAQRELLEETGYRAGNWQALGAYTVDGTRGICRAHLYLATQLEQISRPLYSDMEELELVLLDRSALAEAVRDGSICLLPDIALLSMVFGSLLGNNTVKP